MQLASLVLLKRWQFNLALYGTSLLVSLSLLRLFSPTTNIAPATVGVLTTDRLACSVRKGFFGQRKGVRKLAAGAGIDEESLASRSALR